MDTGDNPYTPTRYVPSTYCALITLRRGLVLSSGGTVVVQVAVDLLVAICPWAVTHRVPRAPLLGSNIVTCWMVAESSARFDVSVPLLTYRPNTTE